MFGVVKSSKKSDRRWKETSTTGLAKVQSWSISGGKGWNEGLGAAWKVAAETKETGYQERERRDVSGSRQSSTVGGDGACQVTMAQLPGDTGEEVSSLHRHGP